MVVCGWGKVGKWRREAEGEGEVEKRETREDWEDNGGSGGRPSIEKIKHNELNSHPSKHPPSYLIPLIQRPHIPRLRIPRRLIITPHICIQRRTRHHRRRRGRGRARRDRACSCTRALCRYKYNELRYRDHEAQESNPVPRGRHWRREGNVREGLMN